MRRGVETLVQSLANELAKRDLDVSVLTAQQTQTPLVPLSPQVRVKQFPTFRYYEFATIAPLYAFDLIRNRYDVVIVFFADFGEGRVTCAAICFATHDPVSTFLRESRAMISTMGQQRRNSCRCGIHGSARRRVLPEQGRGLVEWD
jgi:hypothetical protein